VRFFLGLDLGQAADYTAIAVLEKLPGREQPPEPGFTLLKVGGAGGYTSRPGRPQSPRPGPGLFHCRHLERMPLGTPYPAIVRHVVTLLEQPELTGDETSLVVDATGCGRPVIDMIRQRGLNPVPRDLVSVLQVTLQTERLKFAKDLPAVETLVQELLAFGVKISEQGHDSYGSWREGSHDDLVLALACAVWFGERWEPPVPRRHIGSYSYYTG
jgi:hypothetical protein